MYATCLFCNNALGANKTLQHFPVGRRISISNMRSARFNRTSALALEMSLHESDEQRAMEGELKELEQRWREADAIAKLADEMFLPSDVAARLDALKKPPLA